jgi:hypothetical protein
MIPKLAAAALVLTGCGSDGGNTAGTGGTAGSGGSGGSAGTGGTGGIGGALAESLEAFCVKLVECFPAYYDSTQECVAYLSAYYPIGGGVSATCEAAIVSYLDCGTQLSCDELYAYSNSCDDEFDAVYPACS